MLVSKSLNLSILTLFLISCLINASSNIYDQYLTHYWPITNGKMLDEIGSAHMFQGNLTTFTTDRFDCLNSSLALNGGWTHVQSGIFFNTLEFTISVWVYPQQVGSWSRVIDFGNGFQSDNIIITLDTGENIYSNFQIYEGSSQSVYLKTTESLTIGKWQFLTVTFNKTHAKFYIDGKLKMTSFNALTMKTLTRSLCYIGKSHWSGDGYSKSYLDDLRFYNKSLIESEIVDLMNQNETSKKYIKIMLKKIKIKEKTLS